MKKKIICAIIIILSFVLMCSSISINDITIKNARERIINEMFTEEEPTEEIVMEEQMGEMAEGEEGEVIEEDKTNSYNEKELFTLIASSILFAVAFITIIFTTMSLFNAIKYPITLKVSIIYTILVILLSEIIIITTINYTDKNYLNGKSFEAEALKQEKALYVVNSSKKESSLKLESDHKDETVLKITNESTYNASKLDLTKVSGLITDLEENKSNGLNNVLVVNKASTVSIKDSKINSNNENSSAIYSSGLNTLLDLNNITINTTNNNSNALIAKDESELNIKNSNITTTGLNSELFVSSSLINADNITATTNSSIATIFKTNIISITNSDIKTNMKEDKAGLFMITTDKQSSESYETASLTLENSKIKISSNSKVYKTIPLFYVYNTNSQINLTNTRFTYGSKKLLSIISEEGSNLKSTTITITDSRLNGDISVDKNSKARININNSTYSGSINKSNESNSVDITFDKTSTWNLTGHSYVNTITFQNQNNIRKYINSNGYNIYCNAKNNEWLGNKTITLPGGGKLIPIK